MGRHSIEFTGNIRQTKPMSQSPRAEQSSGRVCIPHQSFAICVGIPLLAPLLAAAPDIPFGHWRFSFTFPDFNWDLFGIAVAILYLLLFSILFGFIALTISPVYCAGVFLKNIPLVYWIALSAYLCAVIMGYGKAYRSLGGDGLELLGTSVLAAFAAICGAAAGFLLDRISANETIQLWIVRIALTAAVLVSLTWSVVDASTFDERESAWRRSRGLSDLSTVARSEKKSPVACLGHASADNKIRLFSETECTRNLGGNYYSNGECLKTKGGSYSWDLREMNRRCP
jgi:hypothetical protein